MENPKEKYKFNDIKQLIDINIYRFLIFLIKNIILKPNNTVQAAHVINALEIKLDEINKSISENNKISLEHTKENFINILKFVKTQNEIYAAEILENILIIIASYGFKAEKENTFGKYIYNNIERLKSSKEEELSKWFIKKLFRKTEEKKNYITELFKNDISIKEEQNKEINDLQKKNDFYSFLLEINKEKNNNLKYKAKAKTLSYLQEKKINFDFFEDKKKSKESEKTNLDSRARQTNYSNIFSCMNYKNELGMGSNKEIGIFRALFISTYIYYQNKYSPLMKYINEKKDEEDETKYLAKIPFAYDLTGASIQSPYAGIIMAPSRIEPRINKLIMSQNILKEKGCLELSKTLKFNKNIKVVNFHISALKTEHISNLVQGLGLFDNYNVEELYLSSNYLKNDRNEILAKILSHLKGLKTINLSNNYGLKNGISSFLIVLKNLYRQNKINLENLNLNKCLLDDISFYELGQLIQSKYCKLKNLYLDINNIPSNINFLKKLKKNKSLTEIHLNHCNLGNNDIDNIIRIISNANIENLYLYDNKINNFDDCLRIIYRTRLVLDKKEKEEKEEKNKINREDSCLYDLDLSNNECINNNKEQIALLEGILNETTLYCLDLSHILFGADPNHILGKNENNYHESVQKLRKKLDKEQKEYDKIKSDIYTLKIDNSKLINLKKEEYFDNLEYKILEIIKNKNSIYPVFLKEQAKELIKNSGFFDENLNYKEKKDIEKKLVDFMTYKREKEELTILERSAKKKKLILI